MNTMREKIQKLPTVSILLVAANVIVYFICYYIDESLYVKGRLTVVEVVLYKEYARILWSMFLHSSLQHLFNNMVILFFLGEMIEKEMGHFWYALIYLVSGIGGNLLSLLYKIMFAEPAASIGASGAIFGLDGALLALVLFSGKNMPNVTIPRVLVMILLSLYSGFSADNVDNAAHLGGLITGFVMSTILCIIYRRFGQRKERKKKR